MRVFIRRTFRVKTLGQNGCSAMVLGVFLDLGVSLMSYQGLGILCLLGCLFQVILRFGSSVSTWMCISGNLDLGVLCLLGCVFQVIFGSSMSAWMHIPGNP